MVFCNLLVFIVFIFWFCMLLRLFSDLNYIGEFVKEVKSYGFIDIVYGVDGDSSVWIINCFCN